MAMFVWWCLFFFFIHSFVRLFFRFHLCSVVSMSIFVWMYDHFVMRRKLQLSHTIALKKIYVLSLCCCIFLFFFNSSYLARVISYKMIFEFFKFIIRSQCTQNQLIGILKIEFVEQWQHLNDSLGEPMIVMLHASHTCRVRFFSFLCPTQFSFFFVFVFQKLKMNCLVTSHKASFNIQHEYHKSHKSNCFFILIFEFFFLFFVFEVV